MAVSASDIRDAEKALCEKSLAHFVRQSWHIIEPGTPLEWNWHLDVICIYLEAFFEGHIKRLILNVPPGSMKSVLFSVMGPAWKWARTPEARMINLTSEITLATRDNRRMKMIVESDWYQERWGDLVQLTKDQSEKTLFENTARGFRQSQGINGNITGKRGNFLLLDDLVDAKKAFSDVTIQAANDTYDQAVSSRINDPRRDSIGLIMQRLRTNDMTGHLLGKKYGKWTHVKISQESTGEPGYDPDRDLPPEYAARCPRDDRKRGDLMFPAFFTPDFINEAKENLGEYGWAGQHQQSPSPLSGGILKTQWWRVWPDDRRFPKILHTFASWDTAYTEKDLEANAYSACTVWGVFLDERDADDRHPEGRHKIMLLSTWWGRVDFPDLLKRAHDIQKRKLTKSSDAHLIERKASGISLIQSLNRKPKLRVLGYDPKKDGGGDKVARAYRVQPLFQAGIVHIPNREWAHELVKVVSEFPAGGPPCADLTDTVTQAVSYLDLGWWIHHPDDELEPQDRMREAQKAWDVDHEDEEASVGGSFYG